MGINVKDIRDFWPEFESYLLDFFGDKYEKEALMSISRDLQLFFREGYIDEIQFILYDAGEKKISHAYSFKIDFQSNDTFKSREALKISPAKLTETTEKLMFVKLASAFNSLEGKEAFLQEELENNWDYAGQLDSAFADYKDLVAIKNAFRIQTGETRND